MPSRRCHGDHRRNSLLPPLSINYCSTRNVLTDSRLSKPGWDSLQLPPFEKNLYQEHPNTAKRPYAAVRDYLRDNWVTVTGDSTPKPIFHLEEASFPKCVEDGVRALHQGPPSPLEAQCWPIALGGKDLLAVTAAMESRKFLAYLLPVITHILQQPSQQNGECIIALVLVPTRESAEQIHRVATQLEPYSGVRSVCIVGGQPKEPQLKKLREDFRICIATPCRLLHFLEVGDINLLRCTYLVLDEADRMLINGFETHIYTIVEQIRPDRQILVFATSWLADVRAFALPLLRNYVEVSFMAPATCGNVECIVHVCEAGEKEHLIMSLLEDFMNEAGSKAVVIANTSRTIGDLMAKMAGCGWVAVSFYGKKTREERDWMLNAFRSGAARVLVGTPAAMRDLFLEGVRIVVNFDVAESSINYHQAVHRVASFGATCVMHTLVGPEDRGHVKHLISFLRETRQEVPPELVRLAKDKIRNRKIAEKQGNV